MSNEEMSEIEKRALFDVIHSICLDLECSGFSPAMCDHNPEDCQIIRKLVNVDAMIAAGKRALEKKAKRQEVRDESLFSYV